MTLDVGQDPLPISVPFRRRPSLAIFGMSWFLVLVGAAMVRDEGLRPFELDIDVSSELSRLLGVVTALAGGFGLLLSARPLLRRGPAVVIDDQGLSISTDPFVAVLRLRWEEVASSSCRTPRRNSPMVLVELVDPGAFVERLTWPARLLARLRKRNGLSPVLIPGYVLAIDCEALSRRIHAEAIRRRA